MDLREWLLTYIGIQERIGLDPERGISVSTLKKRCNGMATSQQIASVGISSHHDQEITKALQVA